MQQSEAIRKANKENSKDDTAESKIAGENGEAVPAEEDDVASDSVTTVTSSGESLNDKEARLIGERTNTVGIQKT